MNMMKATSTLPSKTWFSFHSTNIKYCYCSYLYPINSCFWQSNSISLQAAMSFFNCTSCFLIRVFVVFFIVFLAHGYGFFSVKWSDGQESFVTKGEVLDACKVSAINFPSEDHNEHVILESSTHKPHTTEYIGRSDMLNDYESIDTYSDAYSSFLERFEIGVIITTYCKVKMTVPPDQNINVTILEADNNDVPSYLYVERDCFNPSCLDR